MPEPPGLHDGLAVEWYKLRHRPLPWLLLGVMLVFVALANLAFLLLALVPPVTPGVAAATAALRQLIAPPNSLYVTLSSVNQVGAMLAIILGATVVGSEQQWGTLRLMLTRQPDRHRYLGSVLLALGLTLLAGLLVVAFAGLLTSLGVALAGSLPVAWDDLAAALTGPAYYRSLAISYLALLTYLLLGVAATLLTRSLATGLGTSFTYYLIDAVLVPQTLGLVRDALVALPGLGPLVEFGSRLLLGYNLTLIHGAASSQLRLSGAAAGLIETAAFPWTSLAAVAVHALLMAVIPFVALSRRDLGAPG